MQIPGEGYHKQNDAIRAVYRQPGYLNLSIIQNTILSMQFYFRKLRNSYDVAFQTAQVLRRIVAHKKWSTAG